MIITRTKNWPMPPDTIEGVPAYLKRLRQALIENSNEGLRDLKDLVIEDSTEPPAPYPGQFWLSTGGAGTVSHEGYCKVRMDETEPTDTVPGMLWYATTGGTSPGTKTLMIRNEDNSGWYTFVGTDSTVSDFVCYVSSNDPATTDEGMLWYTIPTGGMPATDAALYTCRAYVGATEPSPTSSRMVWYQP